MEASDGGVGPGGSTLSSRSARAISTDALLRVLQHLPPNEVACTARLLCKETARRLSAPQHRTLRLSQPIPPHAASWRFGEEALRQLSFKGKLGALSMAAAWGCEAKLEVAWRLLSPSFFPGMPLVYYAGNNRDNMYALPDPGTAAARAGHAHLLPWMVEHGCPLDAANTLEAVAELCDLAALQQAVELFGMQHASRQEAVLKAAARSRTPDALGKLQWLVEERGCKVAREERMAPAAMKGGNMDCIRWLQGRGCAFSGPSVLYAALKHASVEVVQWAGQQPVPAEVEAIADLFDGMRLSRAAGSAVQAVAKLRWLQQERGANPAAEGHGTLCTAALTGGLEVVRYLVEECGAAVEQEEDEDGGLAEAMAEGGDREVMQYLLQRGVGRSPAAYGSAARKGDPQLLRWLLSEGFPLSDPDVVSLLVEQWPVRGTPGCVGRVEEDCLAAVQAVVAAGAALAPRVVTAALHRGSLPLVRWLVEEKGCELPRTALEFAAQAGCVAVLEWLVARGCPFAEEAGTEFVVAARQGDRATLQLLRQLGGPWERAALPHTEQWRCGPPVLQWFADNEMLNARVARRASQGAAQIEKDEDSEDSEEEWWLE